MADESITIGKDMLYGGAVVVLACLLMISVFTSGFGIVKPAQVQCPACNCQNGTVANNTGGNNGTVNPPAGIPQITVQTGKLSLLGQASAPVTIVQFSDYQCPYCERLFSGAEASVRANYVDSGKVKISFRDYPLGFHPNAMPAAIAANCAAAQGKFWPMHDMLFQTQSAWSGMSDAGPTFKSYAANLSLDAAAFAACYDGKAPLNDINADEAYAQGLPIDNGAGNPTGVLGTPGSFIIVPKSRISLADMQAAVDALDKQYGAGALPLFEDSNDYTVFVPGAFPYAAFDGILSKVRYS